MEYNLRKQHRSMADVKIYKGLPHIFCTGSYRFRNINILDLLPSKSQGHGVQFWQCRLSMANVKIYKRHFYILYFLYGMTCAHDCNRQTDRQTDRQKDRQTDRHTYRQTDTHARAELDKPIAIGEILHICLKM